MIGIDEKCLLLLPAGSQHLLSSEWMGSVNTIFQISGTWRLDFPCLLGVFEDPVLVAGNINVTKSQKPGYLYGAYWACNAR